MEEIEKEQKLTINKETVNILVSNVIPATKYFETRFDFMQHQIDGVKKELSRINDSVVHLESKMEFRFSKVDRRFDGFDEKYQARFADIDKRFEKIIVSIDRLGDKIDGKIDKQRDFTVRIFTIAVGISFLGAMGGFLKILGYSKLIPPYMNLMLSKIRY